MLKTVKLPKDGAAYRCTWLLHGHRCETETTLGISITDLDNYNAKREAALKRFVDDKAFDLPSIMRVLCPKHVADLDRLMEVL